METNELEAQPESNVWVRDHGIKPAQYLPEGTTVHFRLADGTVIRARISEDGEYLDLRTSGIRIEPSASNRIRVRGEGREY